jgi:hypothetical protein
MSTLAALKLTNTRKPTQQPPIVQSRNKLARRIWEQMELARAQAAGSSYTSKKLKSIVDIDGVRKTIEVNKRIKPWWFVADSGKVCVHIRYGNKVVELAKGKTTVELANAAELVATLETIKGAVIAGELDGPLQAVSGQLRAGFGRSQ